MMVGRLPNICFSDYGTERNVLHTTDEAGASYSTFYFLSMDKVKPHCLISHASQAVVGCLLPGSSKTPQSALRSKPRKALGSIRFTWFKTQPGQCRVSPGHTAYLSSRSSKASSPQTGELSDSVCTSQSTTATLPRAPREACCSFPQSPSHLIRGKAAKSAVPCLRSSRHANLQLLLESQPPAGGTLYLLSTLLGLGMYIPGQPPEETVSSCPQSRPDSHT